MSRWFLFGFAASILASSASTQSLQRPKSSERTVTIHFERKNRQALPIEFINNILVLKAEINGKPIWAVLDNRMESSLVDIDFAQKERLPFGEILSPLKTVSSSLPRKRATAVPVTISGQASFSIPMSAIDLSAMKRAVGRDIDLVLGKFFFDNLGFVVRSSKRNLSLGPSGRLDLPASTKFALLLDDRPRVEVDVGGQKLRVTLDLGFGGDLGLSEAAWKRLGLDKAKQSSGLGAALDGKPYQVRHTIVDRMSLGPFEATKIDVSLRPTLPLDDDGLVGLGFLSRFNFYLDQKARRLWLLPGASETDRSD